LITLLIESGGHKGNTNDGGVEEDLKVIRQLYKEMSAEQKETYISIGRLFAKQQREHHSKPQPRTRPAKAVG